MFGALHKRQKKLFYRFSQHIQTFVLFFLSEIALLIFPVCSHALFGDMMHLLGPDLHLEWLATVADHRRMQRLIQVVPRDRYPVLKTLWNGRPDVVYDAHRKITIFTIVFGDNAGRDQVIDLLDHDLLLFKLFPERIKAFDAPLNSHEGHLILGQFFRDSRSDLFESGLEFRAACINLDGQTLIILGI